MRSVGLFGILALMSACSAPKTPPDNREPAKTESELPNDVEAAPAANGPQANQTIAQAPQNPCLDQDGETLNHKLKAIGTEPFWAAEVQGRCVTYKTPEDQQGTRVWTHVDSGPAGPAWNGALRGRQFQLYVKPAPPPGCSDGMSDKVYSMDAELRVDGETRRGCAEQL